jgi:hypothetical protein
MRINPVSFTAEQSFSTTQKNKSAKNNVSHKRSSYIAAGIGTILLGGITAILCKRTHKLNADHFVQTHFERENIFGRKIVEDLKLSESGEVTEKVIKSFDDNCTAHYNSGKLVDVNGFYPLKKENMTDKKDVFEKEVSNQELEQLSGGKKLRSWASDGCAASVESDSHCWGTDGGCDSINITYYKLPNGKCPKCGGPAYLEQLYNDDESFFQPGPVALDVSCPKCGFFKHWL